MVDKNPKNKLAEGVFSFEGLSQDELVKIASYVAGFYPRSKCDAIRKQLKANPDTDIQLQLAIFFDNTKTNKQTTTSQVKPIKKNKQKIVQLKDEEMDIIEELVEKTKQSTDTQKQKHYNNQTIIQSADTIQQDNDEQDDIPVQGIAVTQKTKDIITQRYIKRFNEVQISPEYADIKTTNPTAVKEMENQIEELEAVFSHVYGPEYFGKTRIPAYCFQGKIEPDVTEDNLGLALAAVRTFCKKGYIKEAYERIQISIGIIDNGFIFTQPEIRTEQRFNNRIELEDNTNEIKIIMEKLEHSLESLIF